MLLLPCFHKRRWGAVENVARRRTEAAKQYGFGRLHTYGLRKILNSKGFRQTQACQVLEICNPGQADRVLAADYSMNLLLPCRLSVCEMGGRTIIAEEAETTMVTIIAVTAADE